MVSFRKISAVAVFAAVIGFALYERYVAIGLRKEVEMGRQNLQRLTAGGRQTRSTATEANHRVGQLSSIPGGASKGRFPAGSDAAFAAEITSWLGHVNALRQSLAEHPELSIPELQLLTEEEWFEAARPYASRFDETQPTIDFPPSLPRLRQAARQSFMSLIAEAVKKFRSKNDKVIPSGLEELKPFLPPSIEPAMLARYDASIEGGRFVLAEKASSAIDPDSLAVFDFDNRPGMGRSFSDFETPLTRSVHEAARRYATAHDGANPTAAEQLRPFLTQPVDSSVLAETFNSLDEESRVLSSATP